MPTDASDYSGSSIFGETKNGRIEEHLNLLGKGGFCGEGIPSRRPARLRRRVRVVKVYGREGVSSGLGLAAVEGAGKTAGGEFVGLAVIFDFAWSIFAVRD